MISENIWIFLFLLSTSFFWNGVLFHRTNMAHIIEPNFIRQTSPYYECDQSRVNSKVPIPHSRASSATMGSIKD